MMRKLRRKLRIRDGQIDKLNGITIKNNELKN
jgi:hypothetical protein